MELSERKEPVGVMDRAAFALQEARGYALEAFPAVRLEGPVNADLMKQAFMETLELFPRLRHVVEVDGTGRRSRLYWREAEGDLSEEKCRRFGQFFFEEMERLSRLEGE